MVKKGKKDWDSFWEDLGVGDFEDIFGDFGGIMKKMQEDMARAFEEPEELMKTGRPKVYGFSLKIGPDGKPVFQRFGDVQAPARPSGEEAREPFSDIIDKENEIRVIVELPGVSREDIKIDCKERRVTVEVDKPERRYSKQIELPEEVEADKSKANYKNGVLEIVLPKKKKGKNIPING